MADYTTRDGRPAQYGTVVEKDSIPLAAAAVRGGVLLALNTSGYGESASIGASDLVVGVSSEALDNSAGNAGDKKVDAQRDYWLDNDTTNAIGQAHLFRSYCYAVDNHTVGSSDVGGTLAMVGVPVALGTGTLTGKVAVRIGAVTPHAAPPAYAADNGARLVATNLEAGAFSAGVFTATANGAVATQDGVAPAVGDVIVLPEGTLTTLVVSAANSGPYVFTAIGSASAKVVLTRPSWWKHGNVVPLNSEIKIAAGTIYAGTTWRSFVSGASAIVIGTGAPALYPLEVTQQVTLADGTITISNVPVRLAARLGFSTSGAIGGTAAATTTNFAIKASGGITIGAIGTAAVIVEAQSVSDTIVNTDVSVINVTLSNR
jgi:hypothetical protein